MERHVNEWTFINESRRLQKQVDSFSHAIGELCEVAMNKIGQTVSFKHRDRGLITCTAADGRSSLSFNAAYDPTAHSTRGLRNALPSPNSIDEDLLFVDATETCSSIPAMYVLPLAEVIRGLIYIFEYHSYPPFLEWTPEKLE